MSTESIRSKVRELIVSESSRGGALSDQKIVERVKGEGIPVARRTVAKYRGQLRIPGVSRRRNE